MQEAEQGVKNSAPIPVPQDVYDALEDIRESGVVNMFDRKAVQYHADQNEAYALVCWLEKHPVLYHVGVFNGFCVEGLTNPAA